MLLKYIVLIFIISFSIFAETSNEKIQNKAKLSDSSLIEKYFAKSDQLRVLFPDSSRYYNELIAKLIKDKKMDYFYPRYFLFSGNYFASLNNIDSAIILYKLALNNKNGRKLDSQSISLSLTNLSVMYSMKENFAEYLRYTREAINFNNTIKQDYAYIYNRRLWMELSDYYYKNDDFEKALNAAKYSIDNAEKSNNFVWIPWTQNFYADLLVNLKKYDEAGKIYKKLLPIADTIYYKKLSRDIYINYSKFCNAVKNYPEALIFAKKAKDFDSKYSNIYDSLSIEFSLAIAYFNNNNDRKANQILNAIYNNHFEILNLTFQKDVIYQLAIVAEKNNDFSEQIKWLKIFNSINDSIHKKQNANLIAKYEVELGLKDNQIKLEKIQIQNEILNTRFIIFTFAFAILFAFILFLYFMKRKKSKEIKLKLENELFEQTISIANKQEVINILKFEINNIKKDNKDINYFKDVIKDLSDVSKKNNAREDFEIKFNQIFPNFFTNLIKDYPELRQAELRILAFIKMNFSSKDISNFLGITHESVNTQRARIRKKLNLNRIDDLFEFLKKY